MKNDVSLVYNNPDPSMGGIPRYAHRIIKGVQKEQEVSHVDFTGVFGENIVEKLYNVLYGRKKFIESKASELENVNHFLQPEIYYNVSNGKDVVTVHDLVLLQGFEDVHSLYELGRKFLIQRRFKNALDNADFFISVSKQTKQELLDYGVGSEKIKVVNLGVREKFEVKRSWSDRSDCIGYLGSLNQRKRVGKLLRDWSSVQTCVHCELGRISKGDYSLEVGGWGGSEAERLEERYGGRSDVVFRGRIPEEDIVDFYNGLKAFFFPTEYEGFGLPIVESVACGTPVFVYSDASISEELKDFCIVVDSVEEAVERVNEGFDDSVLRERAECVRNRFDWSTVVEETEEVYEQYEN